MLMVVTLYAGKVSVSVEPLTACVPIDTGVTSARRGFALLLWLRSSDTGWPSRQVSPLMRRHLR